MPVWFDDAQRAVAAAACERVVPGSGAAGAVDYVDTLLGAFHFDPPRIWAKGDGTFLALSRLEERAWRQRVGELQDEYRGGLAALGDNFGACTVVEQDARLDALPEFKALLFRHAVEGTYGSPDYGGNRDRAGWEAIGFPGEAMPRGYTDAEVSEP